MSANVLDVLTAIGRVQGALPAVLGVVQDPALGQIIQRINTLQSLEAGKGGAPVTHATGEGIGLKRFVAPLDAYVFVRKHTWVPWAVGFGVVAVIGGIGFGLGRVTKR